ncbi:division plane positioning ATPase MipZ [Poseidonocella sedimentorum]|uniref:Chromosome partitioning protein n=1 Tax=Poseidonocella sedimentorum TaxID=871652 RepID=A0A1I6DVT8_9RHOB|nr:division plane positioning ATPase MipZ [Poseidonocella sedimentorum]SFR09555.1 chromosome partitioning protein [Poseidonocella sedimentorum]
MAHIIVVGNEKGGAGKSTVSMHISTALARLGHRVGCLDLDLRQRSLGAYLHNRKRFCEKEGIALATPEYHPLPEIDESALAPGENAYDKRLALAIDHFDGACDFLLIDCPGSHTRLSQIAHSMADTLVTPLNDSFIDFDLLAKTDETGETVLGPSVYSEMVWQARQSRAEAGMGPVDWIVLRNRLGTQEMINKRKMSRALEALAKRIGFRVAPGFGERVVFRELFPRGLTLLDLRDVGVRQLSMSHIAARQEVRDLLKALELPGVEVSF